MVKVKFSNGQIVQFQSTPSPQDIEEVAQKLGLSQPQQEPGLFSRIGQDIEKRQENINQISMRTQSPVSTNFQIIGQGFGAGADALQETGKSIYKTIFPKFLRDIAEKIGKKAATEIANSTIAGQGTPTISELASKGAGKYQEFKQAHPEAAGNIEALGNVARLGTEIYGAVEGVNQVADLAKAGANAGKNIATKFENTAADKSLKNVVELTRPVLNKKEKEIALAAGRGNENGFLKTLGIEASDRDLEVAQAAHSVINPSKSATQNISAINKEIAASSKDVITALERNNSIFNTKQLRSYISSAAELPERQILLAGDELAQKAYKGVVNTFMSVVAKHPKNLKGLLAARKEFDAIAKAGLKGVFSDGVTTARKQAIRDIRMKANEYIAEQLPAGDALKEVLRRQSLLFEARDNIAEKTAENVGTNVITRATTAIKKHPIISTAATAGGVGATVGALINK
jgi:hypothetical protein